MDLDPVPTPGATAWGHESMEEVHCGQAHWPVKRVQPPNFQAILSPTSWPVRTLPAYDVLVAGVGLGGAVVAQLLPMTGGDR